MRSDYRMLWLGPAGLEPLQKFARVRYWPRLCKNANGTCSQNIGLPKRAVFDYFWLGIGRKTPEFEIALSFYTASAVCCHFRELRGHTTLAVSALENDLLEQSERFFLLVEQGRGIEKLELDALDRPFDFHVSRDVADFCQHALSFRADDVVVEQQSGVRVRRPFSDSDRVRDAYRGLDHEPVDRRALLLCLLHAVLIDRQLVRHFAGGDQVSQ